MINGHENNNENFKDLIEQIFCNGDKYSFLSGSEGKAFFVGEKYVCKCFEFFRLEDKSVDILENEFFDNYVGEIKKFNEMGLNFPKIYAHEVFYKDRKKYLYVLQEKIEGRQMFFNAPKDAYLLCRDFLSKEEFFNIFEYKNNNSKLYDEVMRRYIVDFIDMNEKFLSLSDSAVEKYVISAYEILKNCYFSHPDLSSGNVIMGNDSLSIIDNTMPNISYKYDSKEELDDATMFQIVRLFSACVFANKYRKTAIPARFDREFYVGEFMALIEKNRLLSKAAIIRLIDTANKCLDNPKISPAVKSQIIKNTLEYALCNDKMTDEVMSHIFERQ